jgi:NitT/TauT family transport system substrate-binding protein
MNDEWDKISDKQLTMGCVIARKDFVEENPDAVKIFLKEYKESIEAVSNDIETTAALCAEYGVVASAPAAKKAIPFCNIVYQDGEELKENLSAYLNFLYEKAPATVGNALPKDDFYYNAK